MREAHVQPRERGLPRSRSPHLSPPERGVQASHAPADPLLRKASLPASHACTGCKAIDAPRPHLPLVRRGCDVPAHCAAPRDCSCKLLMDLPGLLLLLLLLMMVLVVLMVVRVMVVGMMPVMEEWGPGVAEHARQHRQPWPLRACPGRCCGFGPGKQSGSILVTRGKPQPPGGCIKVAI